jgi:hypothetical protein
MANPLTITLHASGAETVGGSSASVDVSSLRKCARLRLEVTAISGTNPALGVTIETSPSSSGPWRSLTGWTANSVQGQERLFGELDRYVRATWTIGGTDNPAVTFALAGEAHVLYATPSQVAALNIVAGALSSFPIEKQLEACLAVTGEADDSLNSAYTLPLTKWGESLTKQTGRLAVLQMLDARGWQPEGPDARLVDIERLAHGWFKDIAAGRLRPPDIVDSTPTTYEGGGVVASGPSRGW